MKARAGKAKDRTLLSTKKPNCKADILSSQEQKQGFFFLLSRSLFIFLLLEEVGVGGVAHIG
jgi:hypothetical protein